MSRPPARSPVTCRSVPLPGGGSAVLRGRGPLTAADRAAVQALADALLAQQRVVHLQPAKPRRFRTLALLWAWGALGLPCRRPVDGVRRCGACGTCEARSEALRTWFR